MNIYEELNKQLDKNKIKIKEPMCKHTSFKIGGPADIFIYVNTEEELKKIIDIASKEKCPIFILGNGTNLLVKDKGIRGIVLKLEFNNIKVNEENKTMDIGASVDIKEASKVAMQHSFEGFEFACGIPGSIGGGVRMNAGAYGGEIKDILISVRAMKKNTGEIIEIKNSKENFNYRNTIFYNNEYVIISAKFQLKQGDINEIKSKMDEYTNLREKNQPLEMPSAGSTFKRGDGFLTSLLIEQAGLKGTQIGGAAISKKHGGFVVNTGNATAEDVLKLVEYIKKKIKEIYNKDIQLEVEVVGE